MCTRSRGNSKSHGTTGLSGSEPSSLMSFCVAVTRSTSVYDSSATFSGPSSAITVARELPRGRYISSAWPHHSSRAEQRGREACAPLGSSISSFVPLLCLVFFFFPRRFSPLSSLYRPAIPPGGTAAISSAPTFSSIHEILEERNETQ